MSRLSILGLLLAMCAVAAVDCSGTSDGAPTYVPTAPPATKAPTPVPTATPARTILVSPTSLSFTNVGTAYAQTFGAVQAGASPTVLSAVSQAPGVATVSPGETAGTFGVTPVAAGATSVIVTGENGATASVSIIVTTTPATLSESSRE